MPRDLYVEYGLHRLAEWPGAQDAALALLKARVEAPETCVGDAAGGLTPPENDESRAGRDS